MLRANKIANSLAAWARGSRDFSRASEAEKLRAIMTDSTSIQHMEDPSDQLRHAAKAMVAVKILGDELC